MTSNLHRIRVMTGRDGTPQDRANALTEAEAHKAELARKREAKKQRVLRKHREAADMTIGIDRDTAQHLAENGLNIRGERESAEMETPTSELIDELQIAERIAIRTDDADAIRAALRIRRELERRGADDVELCEYCEEREVHDGTAMCEDCREAPAVMRMNFADHGTKKGGERDVCGECALGLPGRVLRTYPCEEAV